MRRLFAGLLAASRPGLRGREHRPAASRIGRGCRGGGAAMASPSSTRGWLAQAACRPPASISSAIRSDRSRRCRWIGASGSASATATKACCGPLPDRGRNDPEAGLFYDYRARLHRFRITFTPRDGKLAMVADGGMELRDFRAGLSPARIPDRARWSRRTCCCGAGRRHGRRQGGAGCRVAAVHARRWLLHRR